MCGIFGIFGNTDAAANATLGLHALQHRGQEGAGIATWNHGLHCYHAIGRVGENFDNEEVISQLPGDMAIGHVRYSTTGGSTQANVQPLKANLDFGEFALVHNGDITNFAKLKRQLVTKGSLFQTTGDTEVILHLMAMQAESDFNKFQGALQKLEGAFSIIAICGDRMFVARDSYGFRPLVMGELDKGFVFASETCALDIIGAKYIRDIHPGEVLIVSRHNILSTYPLETKPTKFCVFEQIYFSRPDSIYNNDVVYDVRKRIGVELAKESAVETDIVIPVPDSGVASALGYAQEANIPFEMGITRSPYSGRTFIQPTQKIRDLGVKLKHNALKNMKGKSVTLIDDSIVRGTTSKKIITLLNNVGVEDIHVRIASPAVKHSCYYGLDTPTKKELIASRYTEQEVCNYIGATSLKHISMEGIYRAVGNDQHSCDACFTGDYPVMKENNNNEKIAYFDEDV